MNLKQDNSTIINFNVMKISQYYNESTAGADASMEMQKLHNIKLLIAFIHMINIFDFAACKLRVGND